jgi:hypothetical protein
MSSSSSVFLDIARWVFSLRHKLPAWQGQRSVQDRLLPRLPVDVFCFIEAWSNVCFRQASLFSVLSKLRKVHTYYVVIKNVKEIIVRRLRKFQKKHKTETSYDITITTYKKNTLKNIATNENAIYWKTHSMYELKLTRDYFFICQTPEIFGVFRVVCSHTSSKHIICP